MSLIISYKIIMHNEQKYYVSWIEVLKGIGIILVVIGHINTNTVIYNWLYSFHMPLFFFASGWVYKKRRILVDVKRRFQTIVIPYFSFGFLEFVYWAVLERRFREPKITIGEGFCGIFLGQYDYLEFNVHLWFLPCFFVLVLMYNTLMNINKILAYAVVLIMSILYLIVPLPQMIWGIDRVFQYILFYFIGNVLAEYRIDGVLKKLGIIYGCLCGVLFILINFIFSYGGLKKGLMWFVTALIGVIGVTIITIIINKNKLFQYIGGISLTILCVHGPIYRILIKFMSILVRVSTDTVRENLLLVMILTSITLCISIYVYKLLLFLAPWMIGKKKKYN